ncbi:uracil-DNA glycosylase [bacterium]|nr:uracil-DNA glycosylase [bacterium]
MSTTDVLHSVKSYLEQQRSLYGNAVYGLTRTMPDQFSIAPAEPDFSVDSYRVTVDACRACSLTGNDTVSVFGYGNPRARLMIVGGVPGAADIQMRRPFTGQAGTMLKDILNAVDFSTDEVYLTNVMKCRTPRGRLPLVQETEACLRHLEKQVELIRPRIILALGNVAAAALTGTGDKIEELRTRDFTFMEAALLVTYHPGALLQDPNLKYPVWQDVQRMRALYDTLVGDKERWHPHRP